MSFAIAFRTMKKENQIATKQEINYMVSVSSVGKFTSCHLKWKSEFYLHL